MSDQPPAPEERTRIRITLPVLATFETTVDTAALLHVGDCDMSLIKEMSEEELGALVLDHERYLKAAPLEHVVSVRHSAVRGVEPTAQIIEEGKDG